MTQGEVLKLLFTRLPMPEQIEQLDTESGYKAFYFSWRGVRYKVDHDAIFPTVEEVDGKLLKHTDRAALLSKLLIVK